MIGTDGSWLVSRSEILSADLMAGQRVDFRIPEDSARGEAATATRAAVVQGSYETLTGPVAPPTRIVEELAPVAVTRLANGHQVVDFGQNIHGWVRLTRLGAPGETVTLVHGEALDSAGDVTQDHLRPIDFRNPGQFLAAGQVDEVTAIRRPGRSIRTAAYHPRLPVRLRSGPCREPGPGGHHRLPGPDGPGTDRRLHLQR
jgi:alpha-L-rhamnosidase